MIPMAGRPYRVRPSRATRRLRSGDKDNAGPPFGNSPRQMAKMWRRSFRRVSPLCRASKLLKGAAGQECAPRERRSRAPATTPLREGQIRQGGEPQRHRRRKIRKTGARSRRHVGEAVDLREQARAHGLSHRQQAPEDARGDDQRATKRPTPSQTRLDLQGEQRAVGIGRRLAESRPRRISKAGSSKGASPRLAHRRLRGNQPSLEFIHTTF